MIVMKVNTEVNGKCWLQFEVPANGKTLLEYGTANSIEDAKRMMYFRNRKYITSKLHSWIIQRRYSLFSFPNTEDYAEKMADAELLLIKLEHYQKASFWRLCDMIADQSKQIESIAPCSNSRMYPYYKHTILPILQFCSENKSN